VDLAAVLLFGVLFGVGTYLLLERNMIRIILGTMLITYGTNLMLLPSGRLKTGRAPILGGSETAVPAEGGGGIIVDLISYVDPIPQALILTSIVISLATTAFAFVLAYRTVQENGTDDLLSLRGGEHE